MRRKLPIVVLAVVVALATAGVAAATNGGLTPVQPESPNARHTVTAYWVIVGFTAVIFFLVEGLLIAFIWKYRSRGRGRNVEGPQVHGHTRLEVIWTVIPVLILCAIGAVVFFELPKIDSAPASAASGDKMGLPVSDAIAITLEAHQFYWQFDYPNGARSIDTLYVPVGRVVNLNVVATDVIHSWWIPALGGKIQAIPGRENHTWFMAQKMGTYKGQCAELCGIYHASMSARVEVVSQQSYDARIDMSQANYTTALGKGEFEGVCATCHGNLGQGGYGPNIASNSLLLQEGSLRHLLKYGVNGSIGAMPPVGDTWNTPQLKALIAYVTKHIYTGPRVGGTSGG